MKDCHFQKNPAHTAGACVRGAICSADLGQGCPLWDCSTARPGSGPCLTGAGPISCGAWVAERGYSYVGKTAFL